MAAMKVEEPGEGARLDTFKEIKDAVVRQGKEIYIFKKKEKLGKISLKLENAILFCCKKCSSPSIGQKEMETNDKILILCLLCFTRSFINKEEVYYKIYKNKIRVRKKRQNT